MSRPKGSKNKSKENIVESVTNFIEETKPKKYICLCEKCNAPIYSSPIIVNTNYLTGIAYYHREMAQNIKLCTNCAKELSNVVDSWFNKSRFKE